MSTTSAARSTINPQQIPPRQPTLVLEKRHMPFSKSALDGAIKDAAQVLFEIIDMPYDDELLNQFMLTSDGKRMLASTARLLSFINEKNISNLEQKIPL